ncbi:MAG: bifunctional metallophosphatase/5'-nucleotidase [Vicinamibacterales bacterium]
MPFLTRMRWSALVLTLLLQTMCARGNVAPQIVDVQILAFNDFHGSLEPAVGTNGLIERNVVGGVEYLATHVARLRATNPNTVVVSAGDNIGATPFLSGMFHDEPTIEALNEVGLQISTVGNHEFDEGWWEVLRMQRGGCHPVDGCQDDTPFEGAKFAYLSANVVVDPARVDQEKLRESGWTPPSPTNTLFPASVVRTVGGARIGFIGLVVKTAPEIVQPYATRGLTFRPEAEAANEEVKRLTAQGVRTIVVLIHEGATPQREAYDSCEGVNGPVMEITRALSAEVDAVVAGHVHRAYNCTVAGKLVTSAASLGRIVTDIDLRVDLRTGNVVSKSARNTLVTRDVDKATSVTALVERYRPLAMRVGSRVVGSVAAEIPREQNKNGEASLGDVVADAFLEAGREAMPGPAEAALVNTGSLRAGLVGETGADGTRRVTYAQAFEVLPFGNRVQVKTVTGDTIIRWLEQQFDNPGPGRATIMQVAGLTYSFSPSRPAGQRVNRTTLRIGGQPLQPGRRYRVVSNDFVWNGGDAFSVATEGNDPVDVGADVDVLVAYLGKHPAVQPGKLDRLTLE